MTKLRGEQERVAVRAAGLSGRDTELEARLESLRSELGPLTLDVGPGGAPGRAGPQAGRGAGRDRRRARRRAVAGLAVARSDDAAESAREAALGDVHSGAERASRHARRAEGLLGERHREAMRKRVADGEALLDDTRAALAAVEGGRRRDPRPGRAHRGQGRRRQGRRRRDRRRSCAPARSRSTSCSPR